MPDIAVDRVSDRGAQDFAEQLAAAWGRPLLDGPVDHGVAVPLYMGLAVNAPVVACCFADWTGQNDGDPAAVLEDAHRLAAAVGTLARTPASPSTSDQPPTDPPRTIAFVASAHGSAALNDKAPLTHRSAGVELEQHLVASLTTDPGSLASLEPARWHAAGACGAGPLTTLALLTEERPVRSLAHHDDLGVGYMVAAW